jgi:hypothetical protein
MKKLAFILALLFPTLSVAAPLQGYDVLGLAQYCNRYLEAPRLPAVSTLLNTFGDPLPCLDKALARGGLSVVQIDLIDATCWRNRVCPPGVPKPDDLRTIKKRAQLVSALAVKYPSVEFWVSPALEHDVKSSSTVAKMMKAAQEGCPTCKPINSPFSGAKTQPLELHGTKVKAFAVSGDGASSFDGDNLSSDGNDFEHRVSGNYNTFAWWNELNLRCTGEKKFTPPLKRTEKPSADQFKQAYLLLQPEAAVPAAPSRCKEVVKVNGRKGEIFKPNAESYCNGVPKDARSNKPLLIINKKGKRGDKIKVYSSAGKEVGCFAYYGSYEGALHRWYMGSCSGQTPASLFADQGSEWGYTDLGGGKCLLTNSVRRLGTYR